MENVLSVNMFHTNAIICKQLFNFLTVLTILKYFYIFRYFHHNAHKVLATLHCHKDSSLTVEYLISFVSMPFGFQHMCVVTSFEYENEMAFAVAKFVLKVYNVPLLVSVLFVILPCVSCVTLGRCY